MPLIARFSTSVALTFAVAYVPMLPPEHVHRAGIEGRAEPLVHAHTFEDFYSVSSETSIAESHGDHDLALFLTSVYDRVSRKLAPQPVILAAGAAVVPHVLVADGPEANSAQSAHGPPGSAWLTRGPPSFFS
jgi:hypothetical protein